MKKIEAIIRKEKFSQVDSALKKLGVGGLTMQEASGRGRNRETVKVHARGDWNVEEEYVSRLKLEIVVRDDEVKKVVDAIVSSGTTGSSGDGKIFITSLEEVVDIGTNSMDEKAVAIVSPA